MDNPGFEEYVRKVIKLTMQEADLEDFVMLMAKKKAFFARRAEEQWDDEARVVRHMLETAIEMKEEKQATR